MKYEELSESSKGFIDRCVKSSGKTREEVMEDAMVREVIKEYEDKRGINHGK